MLKFLTYSKRKKVLLKLQEVGLDARTSKQITPFRSMAMLVLIELVRGKHLNVYLDEMEKVTLCPELILKYSIFIHIYIQEKNQIQEQKLLLFLTRLLDACQTLIDKQYKKEGKKGGKESFNKSSRSFCNKSMITSRSEEQVVSKQVLLLSTICKPYLGYLMKLIASFDSYLRFQRRNHVFRKYQSWMMVNLLKSISSITSHFTNIGRYYMKPYGHLIILLSKTMSRDIAHLVQATGKYVYSSQSYIISCLHKLQEGGQELGQFVKLLEQISDVNERLLPVYFGKYFFDSMRDVAEPRWLNIYSEDFQTVFKLYEILTEGGDAEKEKRKKRKPNRILATQ